MWGLGIFLIYIADLISGRKNKIKCRLCGTVLKNERELDIHIRNSHK
jgi:hypothetical protein